MKPLQNAHICIEAGIWDVWNFCRCKHFEHIFRFCTKIDVSLGGNEIKCICRYMLNCCCLEEKVSNLCINTSGWRFFKFSTVIFLPVRHHLLSCASIFLHQVRRLAPKDTKIGLFRTMCVVFPQIFVFSSLSLHFVFCLVW